MSPRRDTDLGEKLAVFDAPTHGDRYWDKVDREISGVPSSSVS